MISLVFRPLGEITRKNIKTSEQVKTNNDLLINAPFTKKKKNNANQHISTTADHAQLILLVKNKLEMMDDKNKLLPSPHYKERREYTETERKN